MIPKEDDVLKDKYCWLDSRLGCHLCVLCLFSFVFALFNTLAFLYPTPAFDLCHEISVHSVSIT